MICPKTANIALLSRLGIEVNQESDSDSSGEVDEDCVDLPNESTLYHILQVSKYNWFEVVQHVQSQTSLNITESPSIIAYLARMYVLVKDTRTS